MKIVSRLLNCASESIPCRANHTAVAVNDERIIVCGGENDDVALSDTWIGKVSTNSVIWERIVESCEFEPR